MNYHLTIYNIYYFRMFYKNSRNHPSETNSKKSLGSWIKIKAKKKYVPGFICTVINI